MRLYLLLLILILGAKLPVQSQSDDAVLLATFGNMSDNSCIDNDFSQTIFFAIPLKFSDFFYLRILDPDCGGAYDLSNGLWETNTVFELYGGENSVSELDARLTQPEGNYKSGTLLQRALFAKESLVDGKWVSFGPYRAEEGEKLDDYPGYCFFKIIIEGRTGDDINIYALSLSSNSTTNIEIADASFFEYEKTFMDGEVISVNRFENYISGTEKIQLPVTLAELPEDEIYNIKIEAIDE